MYIYIYIYIYMGISCSTKIGPQSSPRVVTECVLYNFVCRFFLGRTC